MIQFENGISETWVSSDDKTHVWVVERGAGEPMVWFHREGMGKAESISLDMIETIAEALECLKGNN
ncbi:MAG: hypothetical protein LBH44_00370 [Treponema sp.]|jgi:hypothetical protein|nr:hypothetical protein [Treponema sp.]